MAHGNDKKKIEELQGEAQPPSPGDSPIHQVADQASEKMLEEVENLTLSLFHHKLETRGFGDSFRQRLQTLLQEAPKTIEARMLQPGSSPKLLTPNQSNV